MKKPKFFLAIGCIVLAISAVFASKANKTFTPSFSTVTVIGLVGAKFAFGSNFFTTSGGGSNIPCYALLYTEFGKGPSGYSFPLSKLEKFTTSQIAFFVKEP
jgi:hypothetical protein